jgi:sigma-B regulation protein RsbQ
MRDNSVVTRNNVTVIGHGPQVMMLAHGFGCDQNMWRFIQPAFQGDYRIVVFDYVGSGRSDLGAYNAERYSNLNGYAQDVLDICEALDLHDIVFVGHSVSSMIGVLAALKAASRFKSLIMVGPSPCYINHPPDYVGGFDRADIVELIDTMQQNYIGWANFLAPAIMKNLERPELSTELTQSFCSTDPRIARRFAEATFFSDNRSDLPKLTVPSLILQCTDDMIAPPEVGRYMERHTPRSTFKQLRAIGHCPHMSAPEETISAIKEFLGAPPPRAGGIVEFDDEGKIHYANATLAEWMGETADALLGRKFESILSTANKIFFQTHLFPILTLQGHAEEIFLMLLTRDGKRIPVITCARRHSTSAGPRSQCVLLTVHQRRKYEDEILQAKDAAEVALRNNDELRATKRDLEQRAQELERTVRDVQSYNEDLQRVTQILSHDLREPIRKIGLFADLVKGHLENEPETEATVALRKIDAEAAQMENLINAMRRFLQSTAPAPIEKVSVAQLVESVTASVSMKSKFTDWVVECEALPDIEGRRVQLYQLFTQLLENSVKFRDVSRRLRVKISGRIIQQNAFAAIKDRYRYVDCVQIEVRDNGTGFDPKYRDYVFQLLRKVDLNSAGLGVGLALCRKIVALHYGSIQVDPQPQVGTTFTIVLPLVHETAKFIQ